MLIVLTHWGIISSFFWFRFESKKAKDEKVTFAMSVESEVEIIGSAMIQSWTWLGGSAGKAWPQKRRQPLSGDATQSDSSSCGQ